ASSGAGSFRTKAQGSTSFAVAVAGRSSAGIAAVSVPQAPATSARTGSPTLQPIFTIVLSASSSGSQLGALRAAPFVVLPAELQQRVLRAPLRVLGQREPRSSVRARVRHADVLGRVRRVTPARHEDRGHRGGLA